MPGREAGSDVVNSVSFDGTFFSAEHMAQCSVRDYDFIRIQRLKLSVKYLFEKAGRGVPQTQVEGRDELMQQITRNNIELCSRRVWP